MRALDRKLAAILNRADTADDFILADAKDADMAFGIAAAGRIPGRDTSSSYRTRDEYVSMMGALVQQAEVDIMLTSASNGERLVASGVLEDSPVTLAVRGNDSTDIWHPRGGTYPQSMSRPFRSANLARVRDYCDLVLYSVTLNNDVDHDLRTLDRFAAFREEAVRLDMRYFLEVFNPNAPHGLAPDAIGSFVNDSIIRMLAGVTTAERPLFLKMAYNGARPTRELVEHDKTLVVGILGGSAGTTRDTFELLQQASSCGARVALFGRKIQHAESQLDLVSFMRRVLRNELTPEDAVHAYHDVLHRKGLRPLRALQDDVAVTEDVLR